MKEPDTGDKTSFGATIGQLTGESLRDRDSAPAVARGPHVLRGMNEWALFESVIRRGPISRTRLARETRLSKPTVYQSLANLEQAGLIYEYGKAGGRGPGATLYKVRASAAWILGIDMGRYYLRAALADITGNIVSRTQREVTGCNASRRIKVIEELAEQVVGAAGIRIDDITHAVLGTPGVVDQNQSRVRLVPDIEGWEDRELLTDLRSLLNPDATIDNDINLAATGESLYGAGVGVSSFVLLSVGSGLGMGVVVDGAVHEGIHGTAGEIAYMPVPGSHSNGQEASVQEDPEKSTILEDAVSARGVMALARRLGMPEGIDTQTIVQAALDGDPNANRVFDEQAELLASVVATACVIIDPELVVFGGWIGRNAELYLTRIAKRLSALVPFVPKLTVSTLGEDAVLLGAIATGLPIARYKTFQRSTGRSQRD